MKPRIGITRTSDDDPVAEYVTAVEAAGGEVHLLSPDVACVPDHLRDVDGIVMSGGVDVDPSRYGEAAHARTDPPLTGRDAYEFALVRAAYDGGVPTLAICRGLQVANVAFGGSLHQHVPDVFGERVRHRLVVDGKAERGLIGGHDVTVEPDSLLATLVGSSLVTGSRHHQAAARVPAALRIVATCSDGVIEALEAPRARAFWLAVQWHPESTLDADGGRSRALFAVLVKAAQ